MTDFNNYKKTLLVITFCGRKWTSRRVEEYYKDQNDVDILVVDQSNSNPIQSIAVNRLVGIEHYPNKQVPFYKMWLNIIEKYSDYDYLVWNNDDDFTISESVKQINDFINTNDNYSLISGQVVQLDQFSSFNKKYATSEWFKDDVNSDDPLSRLYATFKSDGVHVNPHAVIRKDVFQESCKLIMSTIGTEHSLAPIRYFDKILTFFASTLGYRKTNFDNVLSVRTTRVSTGSVWDIADEYPEYLEKNTAYPTILKRLELNNTIKAKLIDMHIKISEKQIEELLDPNNIRNGNITFFNLKLLPLYSQSCSPQVDRIKEIISTIGAKK